MEGWTYAPCQKEATVRLGGLAISPRCRKGLAFFGRWKSLSVVAVDGLAIASAPPLRGTTWIVTGIGNRHSGQNFLPPGLQLALKINDSSVPFGREVSGFTEVCTDLVQFHIPRSIEVLDQFPVPLANAARRSIVVIMKG